MEKNPAAGATSQNPIPLQFLNLAGRLKRTPREGWLRFIDSPESVADHSFRVALMGLLAPQHLDSQRCMFIGLIHDLAESVVGDIPLYANVPKLEKNRQETLGINYLYDKLEPYSLEAAQRVRSAWHEYEAGKTQEAMYMKEMDKIECLDQAIEYERETHGLKDLAEFQGLASKVHSVEGMRWVQALQEQREKNILRRKQRVPVVFVTGNLGDDDTQFADLAAALSMRHISMAAVLRNASFVAPFLVKDDEPPVSSVVSLLDTSIQEGNNTSGWCLVSGFPRSKAQHREFEMTQKDNYVLSVGPAPEKKMYGGWNPQEQDFAEGHFAEVRMSLKHDTGAYEAMFQAVSAFVEEENKTQAKCL